MAQFDELMRRIFMVVRTGKLTTGTDSDPSKIQLHQVQMSAAETRDRTPRVQEYGFTSMPLPGAAAVVVAVSGDPKEGLIIAVDDARYRLQGLQGGEVAIYDNQGRSVYLTAQGIVVNGGGSNILFTNTPKIIADTPVFEAYGDIRAHGNITDLSNGTAPASMANMRQVYDTHTHISAASGSPTSTPTPTE